MSHRAQKNHHALYLCCLGLSLAVLCSSVLSACNDHEMDEFAISVKASTTQTTGALDRRPVDILFLVDNSNSMCEEHDDPRQKFRQVHRRIRHRGRRLPNRRHQHRRHRAHPRRFPHSPWHLQRPRLRLSPRHLHLRRPTTPRRWHRQKHQLHRHRPLQPRHLQDTPRRLRLPRPHRHRRQRHRNGPRNPPPSPPPQQRQPSSAKTPSAPSSSSPTKMTAPTAPLGLTNQGEVYKEVQAASNDRFCEFRRNIEDSCPLSSKNSVAHLLHLHHQTRRFR